VARNDPTEFPLSGCAEEVFGSNVFANGFSASEPQLAGQSLVDFFNESEKASGRLGMTQLELSVARRASPYLPEVH
jgi:hypothetical protein